MRGAAKSCVFLALALSVSLFFGGGGCGNHAPKLQAIADQTASVGVQLTIDLRATDADGDPLTFDFDAPDLPDIKSRAMISSFSDNTASFTWTPTGADVRDTPYPFDFKVTDGHASASDTVQITVASDSGATPVFREPLGTGTTLDLSQNTCIDVQILVDDTAATMVTIATDDPQIDGGMLTQTDGFNATWHWCPSADQIMAADRYQLHLSATDGTNTATKMYLIVLRQGNGSGCPGMAPVISPSPLPAQSTLLDLPVSADITDDLGVKSVFLYYSVSPPPVTPTGIDLSQMQQVSMTLTDGDALSGTWLGSIPNPVASDPAGTTRKIYYLIEARDNDDPNGTCDHATDAPDSGTFSVDVTNPGGMGNLMACDACTSDAQCAMGLNCIPIGSSGGTFCARQCTGSPPCATGYSCSSSTSLITSVDGVMARYCRPQTLSCVAACVDDSFEENDTLAAAASLPTVPMTYSNLVLCADGTTYDEDFYGISIASDSLVTAEMKIKNYVTGGTHEDLDLYLWDQGGGFLAVSDGTTTTEYLSACVPAASVSQAVVDVIPYTGGGALVSSKYDLTVNRSGPDANEGMDDDANTTVQLTPGTPFNQNICGSDDWFWTILADRDPLVVDLKYTARVANEDLDLTLKKDNNNAPIDVQSGAPIDGGVRINYDTPDGGEDVYYLVVGAKNAGGGNVYTLNPVVAPP